MTYRLYIVAVDSLGTDEVHQCCSVPSSAVYWYGVGIAVWRIRLIALKRDRYCRTFWPDIFVTEEIAQ